MSALTRDNAAPVSEVLGLGGRRRRAALSLAPLIDVTFILLIFFMLVTQFSRLGPVDVVLGNSPNLIEQLKSENGGRSDKDLTVHVHADGTMKVQDQVLEGLTALSVVLEEYRDRLAGIDGMPKPLLAIKPDSDVPLQLLIDVLVAIQEMPQISLRLIIPEAIEDEP